MKQETFRLRNHRYDFFPRGRAGLLCLSVAILCGLAGCTAAWRAPVETRGTQPARANPPRAPIGTDFYRVSKGDTLIGIAWQQGIDYRLVASWNGIPPPYRIYPGQTLRLKPPVRRTSAVQRTKTQPKPATKTAKAPATKPVAGKRAKPSASPARLVWKWPVKGRVLSSFKAGDPLHKGIKIAGQSGKPILAAEGGKVVYSGSGLIGYGQLIIIKHNDNFLSAYGHNRKILVKEGDQVAKGIKIAEMGTANSGDPMLHFEIRRDGKPVDPMRLLPRQ